MQDGSIKLIVTTKDEAKIVTWLLEAAQYPLDRIQINQIAKGQIKTFVSGLPPQIEPSFAVLVSQDAETVPDAIFKARKKVGKPHVKVFCAIPEIESWLFADDLTAIENARTQWGQEILPTLPLPEDIKSPKNHAKLAFGEKVNSWEFIKSINIERAKGRSPSLRYFLNGLQEMLSIQPTPALQSVSRNISRDVFAGLMREIMPADTVMWRTATGDSFTAKELRQNIEEGTEIGQQYSSDVLRVARDFLKRKANRKESE